MALRPLHWCGARELFAIGDEEGRGACGLRAGDCSSARGSGQMAAGTMALHWSAANAGLAAPSSMVADADWPLVWRGDGPRRLMGCCTAQPLEL